MTLITAAVRDQLLGYQRKPVGRPPWPGYGDAMDVDEARSAALGRLTDNERECLRRRLRHQTAKEMAIDLGISPHAVEKRLKMARTKLGLSSSLAAARLLDAAERYGPTIPQTPDLAGAAPLPHEMHRGSSRRRRIVLFMGGFTVMFLIAVMALMSQSAAPPPDGVRTAQGLRPASADEVHAFVLSSFRTMDRDHSGFVDLAEAPARTAIGQPHRRGERPADGGVAWITGRQAQAMWIARADADGDGRVSASEFVAVTTPAFARGIPANWHPTGAGAD